MAAILISAIMNFAILDSAILVFPLKLTHICQDWFPPFAQKKPLLIHSDSLIIAAILNSAMLDSDTAILDSDTLLSSLLSDSLKNTLTPTLTLTQTNSIWLIWWWQPSWILPSWIQPFCTKLWLKLIQSDSNSFILTLFDNVSYLEFCHLGFSHFAQNNFTDSFWLNLMMAAILNSSMLELALAPCYLLSDSFKNTRNTLTLTETHSI